VATVLTFTFGSAKNKANQIKLKYRLYDNDFVKRWAKVLWRDLRRKRSLRFEDVFYGKIFYQEEDLRAQLAKSIAIINKRWPQAITHHPIPDMDQAYLSAMHTEFEHLEQRVMEPRVSEELHRAVLNLNLFIHRYEQLLSPEQEAHIDLLLHPVERYAFKKEDYALFNPDLERGKLYLAYGVTGTPVLSAFLTDHHEDPVPQTNYTSGMKLYLGEGIPLQEKESLKVWLERKGMNPDDPKLALGYIPLGELILEDPSFEDLRRRVARHQKIVDVEITPRPSLWNFKKTVSPLSEKKAFENRPRLLSWPSDEEIFLHLQQTPWIFLPFEFNHQACFEEAARLLDRFVVHRNYDQSSEGETQGKWKSLGIHALGGDSQKTRYHKDYGVGAPEYKLSEIAADCPKTLEFLNRLTRVEECERVRFMLLEPGARIHVHSDVKDREWGMAVNVALNMPEGCEFWTDLEPDGSKNAFSRKIPIQPGQAFLFNNATYHSVENHSDQPRIHLIFHGPLRFRDHEILAAARRQNGDVLYKDLVNRVVAKKALMGKEIPRESKLYGQLMVAGISERLIPDEIALAVMEENLGNEALQHEALHLMTKASLFPLGHEEVGEEELDQWLSRELKAGRKYAVVLAAGTHLSGAADFAIEVLRATHRMRVEDAGLMGHIMDRRGEIPFLHEQFMILDLKRWEKWGSPSFGRPYENLPMEFDAYETSLETVHDDYTPLWLGPSEKMRWKKGRSGWGSRVIAAALRSGERVVNVPISLRSVKKFTYPRAGKQWQYREVKKNIDSFLKSESQRVFVFNNEPLRLPRHKDFVPENLLMPCSGLKPFALARQFCGSAGPEKVSFIDFSPNALEHYTRLLKVKDRPGLVSVLAGELRRQVILTDAEREALKGLERACREAFDGRVEGLLETIRELSLKAEVERVNYITQAEKLVEKIIPGKKTLFWHSNAFGSNGAFYLYSQEQLRQAYLDLGKKVKAKLACRAWVFKGGGEMVFGDDFRDPQAVFTHGYFDHPAQESDFVELT
jgi:hypothetical protein